MKMDSKLLSKEPHETAYVKARARQILKKLSGKPHDYEVIVCTQTLKRLCKFILKK